MYAKLPISGGFWTAVAGLSARVKVGKQLTVTCILFIALSLAGSLSRFPELERVICFVGAGEVVLFLGWAKYMHRPLDRIESVQDGVLSELPINHHHCFCAQPELGTSSEERADNA